MKKRRERTNNAEEEVCQVLEREGYEILTRGWPDLIAIPKKGPIRFIEVKPNTHRRLRAHQARTHAILALYGIQVEIWKAESRGVTSRARRAAAKLGV